MSYQQTLAAYTSMAENTLERLNVVSGAVVPANLVSKKLISHGVDNSDVMKESSTAGYKRYHRTQHAVYQEGPGNLVPEDDVMCFSRKTLNITDIFESAQEVTTPIINDTSAEYISM